MSEVLFPNESYKIVGAVYEVHKHLGPGLLEKVYQEALEIELTLRGVPFEKEKMLPIEYKGHTLQKYYVADFLCYDKIILELKSVEKLSIEHKWQVLNYLNVTKKKIGLLINFGESPLKIKRVII